MKILAFTPTFGRELRPETVASIQAQVCAGSVTHKIGRNNPFSPPDMRNVLAQFAQGRQMALEGGYDALWTVEHDMAVPPDALQLLWDAGAPVAYGVYVLRHGAAVLNAWERLPRSKNMGESLSLHPKKLEQARKRLVVPVGGVGFGCTLIRRAVLEQLPFRGGGAGSEAPDLPFALDCLQADVAQVAHFGVLCGHWDGQRWLRPFDAHGWRAQARANVDVTVYADGETQRLRAAQMYDLPATVAAELQRAGYVAVVGMQNAE